MKWYEGDWLHMQNCNNNNVNDRAYVQHIKVSVSKKFTKITTFNILLKHALVPYLSFDKGLWVLLLLNVFT